MKIQPLKTHKTFDGLTQFWEHESSSTKTKMKFSSFIPPSHASSVNPKGCVIWLSGLTCTDENFITKAGAQKFFAEHGLMVVCPDTSPRGLKLPNEHESYDFGSGASFYVDATTAGYRDHYLMETYIADELHTLITEQFGVPSNRISIAGHSMGGHGAIMLGLRHPDKFKSVSAFSPIVNPMAAPWGQKALAGYLGESRSDWAKYDSTELLKLGSKHPYVILIDQGLADEFYEKQLMTNHFEEAARGCGQPVVINLREGYDHSYYFISTFIQSHVAHHAKALG